MDNPGIVTIWSHARSGLLAGLLALGLLLALAPAAAQEDLTPPEQQLEELLHLAAAYQSSYFDLVAMSCFQLYSSTGIIATDYARGYIGADTALDALDHNMLLLTACLTTLEQIRELTPADDGVVLAEIARLDGILLAEHELLTAVNEVCTNPSDRTEAEVESCRQRVEAALDEYVTVDNGTSE